MPNTSEILIDTLMAWGVDTIFGLPGDGINGIMEALRTRQERSRFIQVRHEESAAFMATAYAKWTGKLGVCLATSGPGGTHLLTGLYDAKLDQAPVLAITGLQLPRPDRDLHPAGRRPDRVFNDVAVFNAAITGAAHMENTAKPRLPLAPCRSAASPTWRSPTTAGAVARGRARARSATPQHVPNQLVRGPRLPRDEELDAAAEILNAASRVAILAGRGALGRAAELEQTADLLGAPVAKALLGKAVLPDDHPLTHRRHRLSRHAAVAGGDGALRRAADRGSTFPYVEYYPKPGQARGVQIDRDGQRIGLRYPVEVGLVGDARETLEMLNERLRRKADRGFLERRRPRRAAGTTPSVPSRRATGSR